MSTLVVGGAKVVRLRLLAAHGSLKARDIVEVDQLRADALAAKGVAEPVLVNVELLADRDPWHAGDSAEMNEMQAEELIAQGVAKAAKTKAATATAPKGKKRP